MSEQGAREATEYGRVPARVLLCGGPDGWRYTIVDQHGVEEHIPLSDAGVHWQPPGRHAPDPEPPWWERQLAETAEALRDHIGRALTDRTFTELGAEAQIAWFAIEEPISWEGLVTLGEPDPARFPDRVPPFVVTLQPGRGALLPDAHLLFSTLASDAWTTLTAVSERCGTPPPRASFLCGYTSHRSVRVGRGALDVSTMRGEDGTERIAQIHGSRARDDGWGGNPELRLRLDGIDLLNEPAADVVALFRHLGHEVVARDRHGFHIPAMGLALQRPAAPPNNLRLNDPRLDVARPDAAPERFLGASLSLPTVLSSWYLNR